MVDLLKSNRAISSKQGGGLKGKRTEKKYLIRRNRAKLKKMRMKVKVFNIASHKFSLVIFKAQQSSNELGSSVKLPQMHNSLRKPRDITRDPPRAH